MKKIISLFKFFILAFALLILTISCYSQKNKDEDLQKAKDYLMLVKKRDYQKVRSMTHDTSFGEQYFIRDVNVAAMMMEKFPFPPDTSVTKEYNPQLAGNKYTFIFHKMESEQDTVAEAEIEVIVNHHPQIKQPITMMWVDYILVRRKYRLK